MRGVLADGQRVTDARLARGLTQEQLAARAELDVKTVRKAEQGKRLDVGTLGRIAAALDVELHRVLRGQPAEQEARREVVLRWQRAFDEQDIEGMLALFHDDAVAYLPGDPTVPFGGTFRGRDAVRACHVTAWASCRTAPVPATDFSVLVSGDTVVLHGVKKVERPDGEHVPLGAVMLFTFRGVRVAELRVEFDTMKFWKLVNGNADGPS